MIGVYDVFGGDTIIAIDGTLITIDFGENIKKFVLPSIGHVRWCLVQGWQHFLHLSLFALVK